MKLFDIPTDNLYKFMALSGIVLIITSYIPIYQAWIEGVEIEKVKGERDIIEIEVEWTRKEIDKITEQMNVLIDNIVEISGISKNEITEALNAKQSLVDINKDLKEHQMKWEELEAKGIEQLKLFREQIIKTYQLKTNSKVVNCRLRMLLWLKRLTMIGSFIGVIMTVSGFGLWYKKLQVPQDLLIQKKLKLESKKEKNDE